MAGNANEETDDFLQELKQQAKESGQNEASSNDKTWTDPKDGTTYEWDHQKKGWFPKIDDDFLAAYQMGYGFTEASEKDAEITAEQSSGTVENRQPQPVAEAEKTEVEKTVC